MTPESNTQAAALIENQEDQAWIHFHSSFLSSKVSGWFKLVGRGAILVDAAAKPLGDSSLFTYLNQEEFERFDDEEINLVLDTYAPSEEFVLVMLKPQDLLHTYRIQIPNQEGLI